MRSMASSTSATEKKWREQSRWKPRQPKRGASLIWQVATSFPSVICRRVAMADVMAP